MGIYIKRDRRELARLAAENITDQQSVAMEEIVNGYLQQDIDVEEGDVAFHDAMAAAAGNQVLKAALDLIRQGGQLSPVFGYIRTHVHSQIFTDHYKVYQAIARRDPDARTSDVAAPGKHYGGCTEVLGHGSSKENDLP